MRDDQPVPGTDAVLRDALRRLDIAERALHDARTLLRTYAADDAQPAAPATPATPERSQQPAARPPAYPTRAPQPTPPDPRRREKTLIGAVALGGTVITLAGVALLVGLAIQAGLLGPVGRVILAYAVAAALLGGAWWFRTKAPAAGVTALLATSYYAATATASLTVTWLKWWPGWLGAVVMAFFYAGYLVYAERVREGLHKSTPVWLAVGAVVAAFYFPASAGSGSLVVLALPIITLAYSCLRRSDALRALGGAPLAFFYPMWDAGPSRIEPVAVVILASLTAVGLVALAMYAPTKPRGVGEVITGMIVPVILLLTGIIYADTCLHLWMVMAAIVLIAGVAWGEGIGSGALAVAPVAYGFFALDTIWAWHGPELSGPARDAVWVLLCLFFFAGLVALLPYLSGWYHLVAWACGSLMMTYTLARGVVADPAYLLSRATVAEAALVAVALVVGWFLRRRFPQTAHPVTAAAVLLFALYLSMLAVVGMVTYVGGIVDPPQPGDGYGFASAPVSEGMYTFYFAAHALVSVSWMILAARLLLSRAQRFTGVGILLAIVAVSKLTFFDLAATAGIFRALAFLISGIALLTIAVRRTSS